MKWMWILISIWILANCNCDVAFLVFSFVSFRKSLLMHTLYMRKQVNEKTSQLTGNFIFFDGEKVCLCRNSKSTVKKPGVNCQSFRIGLAQQLSWRYPRSETCISYEMRNLLTLYVLGTYLIIYIGKCPSICKCPTQWGYEEACSYKHISSG
jgi:hypothetical protein